MKLQSLVLIAVTSILILSNCEESEIQPKNLDRKNASIFLYNYFENYGIGNHDPKQFLKSFNQSFESNISQRDIELFEIQKTEFLGNISQTTNLA